MPSIISYDKPKTKVVKLPTYIHNLLNAILVQLKVEREGKGFIGLSDILQYMIEKCVIEESRSDEVLEYFKKMDRKDWVAFSNKREEQFTKIFKLRAKKSLDRLRRLPAAD